MKHSVTLQLNVIVEFMADIIALWMNSDYGCHTPELSVVKDTILEAANECADCGCPDILPTALGPVKSKLEYMCDEMVGLGKERSETFRLTNSILDLINSII